MAYVRLSDEEVAHTACAYGLNIDLDSGNKVVGVEFLEVTPS